MARQAALAVLLTAAACSCAPAVVRSRSEAPASPPAGTAQSVASFPASCFSVLSLLQDVAATVRPADGWTPYTTSRFDADGLVLESRALSGAQGVVSSTWTCSSADARSDAVVRGRTVGLSPAQAREAEARLLSELTRRLTPAQPG